MLTSPNVMVKYNCLIVDDEPIARDIIASYCSHLTALNVVGMCGNALEAKEQLQQLQIDILFLDINMPVLDGIAFLKTLKVQPQVIFTTAYKEYATDAFDLAACDYLLKPFSLERFIIAVDKAIERLQPKAVQPTKQQENTTEDFFFIKTEGKIYKIMFNELLYAEANGNYTRLVTTQSTLLPGTTFTSIIELLPMPTFLRVHRSFMVNKAKITHIEGNRIFIDQTEIPIGSNYRESFLKGLGL